MSLFAKRHFGVSALILTAGLTTGTLTDVAVAMPFQDAPPQQNDQQRVDSLLSQARDHMRNAQWSQAADAFQSVLRLQPGNEEAVAGLKEAQALLDQRSGIEDVQETDQLRRQQAIAEFDNAMQQANEQLQQGQYTEAEMRVITAQVALGRARNDLSETEFNSRNDRARSLLSQIQQAKEMAAAQEAQQTLQEQEAARRAEQEAEARRRQAQNEAALVRVRELQMQMKYDEALQVVEQILFRDETNPAALALRDAIQTTQMWVDVQRVERDKEMGFSWNIMKNREAMVAPRPNLTGAGPRSTTGLVQYPEDWPELSIRRTSDLSFADTEANRRVATVLDQSQIPQVDFRGHSVEQLFAYMEEITGVDFHPDWKALEFIGVRPSDEVTLQLRNVNTRTVLSRMLEQLGDQYERPDFAIQDGLVVVSSQDAIRRHTITKVYDIKDLLFEAPYFDNAPNLDLDAALASSAMIGGNGFGGGGMGIGGGGSGNGNYNGGNGGNLFSGGGKDQRKATDREQMIDQIVGLIQENVEYDSWRDLGGDTGSISELNGNLIITNTPRAIQGIDGLLSMLREVRALQINVEARFLTVDMSWFEKIGFDLDVFFNTNNTLRQQQLAVDPLGHLSDFFDNRGRLKDPLIYGVNTTPYGQLFGTPNNPGAPIPTYSYVGGPVGTPLRNTQGFSPIGVNQNSFDLVDLLGNFDADSFAGEVLNNAPALSLGIQFLDDIQVDLLIEATQADRRNVVLTAPRLTLFNGQRSWVTVGTQTAIISALIPIVGDASGAFQPVLTSLTDGVSLDIEAVVSADRRYVCMTVITGVRQIISIEELQFSGAAGGGGDGAGGDAAVFSGVVSLPTVEVALINTTTCVPDKGTILLGGQRLVSETEVEVGVPILSKIPFINRFFTNRVTSKSESTLLILIRPEIIIQQENEDLLYPGLSDTIGSGTSYGNF